MRFQSLVALLLVGTAVPAPAQPQPVERRIERLEGEMRAVQRRVFPNGRQAILEPEVSSGGNASPTGVPAAPAIADLTARVDALEAQLARLTGQVEEGANRIRQMEVAMAALKNDGEARAAAAAVEPSVESVGTAGPAPAQQRLQTADEQSLVPEAAASRLVDAGEDAYLTGFRLWEEKKYEQAQQVLEEMAKAYPKHRRASWARNLAGRALLESGKHAAAAKALFANYEADPKGERAPDSLFYLGDALTRLKKTAEACQVYAELQNVYGSSLRDPLKQGLPKARAAAGCSA